MTKVDVCISGGGIAGLIATLAFARSGFSVACIEPNPSAGGADKRTTAFLQPSWAFLKDIGMQGCLSADAMPLQHMAIAVLSPEGTITATHDFDAQEVSDEPFGWNVANTEIRAAVSDQLASCKQVELITGVSVQTMLARDNSASIRLSDGTKLRARLVVAADGRNSPLRSGAGIGVKKTSYGQKALAFSVRHALPHNETSTEIHRSGGPFTLVPLPDAQGYHRSSVVWMERGAEVKRLAALDPAGFEAAINERSGGILGQLTCEGTPQSWPIISQRAECLTAQRLALIAEAAHVVPPIGAQGLNMSLSDLRALCNRAIADPDDLGSDRMLDAYARDRLGSIRARVTGIDALNRASMAGAAPIQALRAEMLKWMHGINPVRRGLMRAGIG